MKKLICLAVLILSSGNVEAQQPRPRKKVDSSAEAIRLLYGPQGLPSLTRPANPYGYGAPYGFNPGFGNYGYRPNVIIISPAPYIVNPYRGYNWYW